MDSLPDELVREVLVRHARDSGSSQYALVGRRFHAFSAEVQEAVRVARWGGSEAALVAQLRRFSALTSLELSACHVSDALLGALALAFPSLRCLEVDAEDCAATSAGLEFLIEMNRDLRTLEMPSCPLPRNVTLLQDLRALSISCPKWPGAELACLPALRSLALLSPEQHIPASVSQLTGLTQLRLLLPNLAALPPEMGALTSLASLSLFSQRLPSLPPSFSKLAQLRHLDLGFDGGSKLPEGLHHLTALTSLSLAHCNALTDLVPTILALPALRSLQVQSSEGLSYLPSDIGRLSRITALGLLDCPALHALPPGIGAMQSLQSLALGCLPALQGLPEAILRLSSLRSLTVTDCPAMRHIPEGVEDLLQLDEASRKALCDLRRQWPGSAMMDN